MSTSKPTSNSGTGTNFAPRPSTTVPPAAQTFEPLAKTVLSHRLIYNIFAYSAAFTLASSVFLAPEDGSYLILRLFRPSTWVKASLAWLVGVLPIIVVRKTNVAPNLVPTSSPFKTVATALANPNTRRWIAVYITSSVLLLLVEILSTWPGNENMRLAIFVQSKKHPYYLNGRLIFLVFAQVWLSFSFALRNVMLERFAFRWGKIQPPASVPFAPQNVMKLLITVTLFTFTSFALYNVAFALARLSVLPLLLSVPLVRTLFRPFVGHFVKGPWTLTLPLRHISLEYRAFCIALSMLANWEFADSLFDVYVPRPIKVASTTADPNVTLVSGITSGDPLYLHFAYAELRDVAVDDHPSSATRRSALFSDQKFSPSLWNTLARESLLRLGQDYQTFLRRGAPAPAVSPVPAPAPKPPQPPSSPLLRKAIYKAPSQSPISKVLNTFASGPELTKVTEVSVSEGTTQITPLPELFRSVSAPSSAAISPLPKHDAPTSTSSPTNGVIIYLKAQCRSLVVQYSPIWLQELATQWEEWWSRDRINKLAERSLPNREVDTLIVQVLSGLVCASLTEDRYGVVQRDIPRILEAFVSFLSALEDYQLEVTKLYVPPTPEEITGDDLKILREKERTRVEVARATEVIGTVADALKSGIADIVRTFGDKLAAFKFPPRTAKKLQAFVDYA